MKIRRERTSLGMAEIPADAPATLEPCEPGSVCEGCAGGPTGNPRDWTAATVRVTWPDYPGAAKLVCEVCARRYGK